MSRHLLVFGDNPERIAEEFPGYKMWAIDPLSIRLPATARPSHYDIIYASLVLQRVPYRKVVATLKKWAHLLKHDGKMYITVPSLEWAAVQIVSEKPLPVIMPFIFGNQGNDEQYYKSGFMLAALRNLVVAAGLDVRTATPFEATVMMGNEEYKVGQLLVLATRPVKRKGKRGRKIR
jgi:predicted SAM-dependent methyltransferase